MSMLQNSNQILGSYYVTCAAVINKSLYPYQKVGGPHKKTWDMRVSFTIGPTLCPTVIFKLPCIHNSFHCFYFERNNEKESTVHKFNREKWLFNLLSLLVCGWQCPKSRENP